jgi:uncharacterized membrane protein (UPF0127 family)
MSLSTRHLAFAVACAALFVASAGSAQGISYVNVKQKRYTVEIADDDAARERGLMYREHMEPDHGMLFVFEHETPQAFWMKNTKIALDMLFLDHTGKLVGLQERVPPCKADPCPVYPSGASALYVLELNGGAAKTLGLKLGDSVEIHR